MTVDQGIGLSAGVEVALAAGSIHELARATVRGQLEQRAALSQHVHGLPPLVLPLGKAGTLTNANMGPTMGYVWDVASLLLLPAATPTIPASAENSGQATAPVAGQTIVTVPASGALGIGTYTVAWQVGLNGAAAAGDANNFGLYVNGVLQEASVNPGAAGSWQQEPIQIVSTQANPAVLSIRAVGIGTAGVVYSAAMVATLASLPGAGSGSAGATVTGVFTGPAAGAHEQVAPDLLAGNIVAGTRYDPRGLLLRYPEKLTVVVSAVAGAGALLVARAISIRHDFEGAYLL